MSERGSKDTNLLLHVSHGDTMHDMETTVNNTVLHFWKLLRVNLKREKICNHIW